MKEKEIYIDKMKEEDRDKKGKQRPVDILDMIVTGQLRKYYTSLCRPVPRWWWVDFSQGERDGHCRLFLPPLHIGEEGDTVAAAASRAWL